MYSFVIKLCSLEETCLPPAGVRAFRLFMPLENMILLPPPETQNMLANFLSSSSVIKCSFKHTLVFTEVLLASRTAGMICKQLREECASCRRGWVFGQNGNDVTS